MRENAGADFLGEGHEFEQPRAPFIAGLHAIVAALAPIKPLARCGFDFQRLEELLRGGKRFFARGAYLPQKTLAYNPCNRADEHVWLDPHVAERGDGSHRGVCMQCAEDQVASKGGAHGDAGRFGVANFTDHDDIGILPQNRTQPFGKTKIDIGIDLDLVDPGYLVFDRIFNGDDVFFGGVDGIERCIKG